MNYEELVKNQAGKLIEKLVLEIRNKKAVDVRFEFMDNDPWSVISVYMDEQDNELALRLHPGDSYVLSEEERKGIPKSMQKVMGKVLSNEEGLRVPGTLLST